MPGTIQVSVVEFKSSSSSPTSLKVSIGRRGYETWDNGDFSFPLTTLRDNLIVALQDGDGNEISRTGVGIMLIVEKGSWDDYFPFEGGGEVHMKLHFVLSEEERDRVRVLRESALKKKQQKQSTEPVEISSIDFDQKITGMLNEIMAIVPSQNMEMTIPPNVASVEDEAAATSSVLGPDSEYHPQFDNMKEEEKSSAVPNINEDSRGIEQRHATVGRGPSSDQEASSKSGLLGSESISPKPNDDFLHKSEVQKPIKKSPSAIWKMINAFETNLSQDPRTPVKSSNLKSQSDQVGKRFNLKDTSSEDVTKPADISSSFVSRTGGNISSYSQDAENKEFKYSEREDVDNRMISDELHEDDDVDIKRVVGETSEVSNSKELVKLPLDLTRNSERTFSGKEVTSLFEKPEPEDSRILESENHGPESKEEDVTSQGDHPKKDDRGLGKQRNSRPVGSPELPGGLVRQAIKIAIFVGFGVLVLLNRQREPRKSKKEASNRFNEPFGFMDEGPFSIGPMD